MTTKIQPANIDQSLDYSVDQLTANSIVINSGLTANGTIGLEGQVLTSNGTIVYWANTQPAGFDPFLLAGM